MRTCTQVGMSMATRSRSSWFAATSIHVVVFALLLLAAARVSPPPLPPSFHEPTKVILNLVAPPPPRGRGGDSGGGHSDPDPAQQGRPPKPAPRAFTMLAVNRTESSVLEIVSGADVPDLDVSFTQLGDPLGAARSGSLGIGRGITIGDGDGNSVGPGNRSGGNPGKGGTNGLGTIVKLTRRPQVIYQVEPEYSEPARKAHLQGAVKLRIDVSTDGRAINIRILEGMGLGLDEAAIDAVKRWRFQPALSGTQPVVAPAIVEVAFHLL
jgi:protein TonB